jgi:hypothetical protein
MVTTSRNPARGSVGGTAHGRRHRARLLTADVESAYGKHAHGFLNRESQSHDNKIPVARADR